MSSKPSVEGVAELRKLILRRREILDEVADLQAKVKRIKDLEHEHSAVYQAILDMLENMDCKSTGNAGWEGRFFWMLDQLELQASSKVISDAKNR